MFMTTMTEREQFLSDVLTTAVEGGINYWAATSGYRWYEGNFTPIPASVKVHEMDDENGGYYEKGVPINTRDIDRAIRRIMNVNDEINYLSPHTRALVFQASVENDAGNIDADVADIIMQIAVLGEVRYG